MCVVFAFEILSACYMLGHGIGGAFGKMPRTDQGLIQHPNAKASWRTVRLRLPDDGIKTILEVKTDLQLKPEHPDFNQRDYDSLINAVTDYLAKNPLVDAADIDRVDGE
jgi:hypothetical protein